MHKLPEQRLRTEVRLHQKALPDCGVVHYIHRHVLHHEICAWNLLENKNKIIRRRYQIIGSSNNIRKNFCCISSQFLCKFRIRISRRNIGKYFIIRKPFFISGFFTFNPVCPESYISRALINSLMDISLYSCSVIVIVCPFLR